MSKVPAWSTMVVVAALVAERGCEGLHLTKKMMARSSSSCEPEEVSEQQFSGLSERELVAAQQARGDERKSAVRNCVCKGYLAKRKARVKEWPCEQRGSAEAPGCSTLCISEAVDQEGLHCCHLMRLARTESSGTVCKARERFLPMQHKIKGIST